MRSARIRRMCFSDSVLLALVGVLALAGCSATAATTTTATTTAAPADVATTATTTTALTPVVTTTSTTTTTAVTTTVPTSAAPETTLPDEIPERSLLIPAAPPPKIDGAIDDGEWEQAVTVAMSNDDIVYWMHNGATLYVALDGTELGAVNLVIATGDELWVLHSSAALGSLLFLAGEEGWEQSHGYTWCCRRASDDSARLRLLESEKWQANIGFIGDVGVVEYQVAIPWGYATAAMAYLTEDRDPEYWPTDISPDAVSHLTNNEWTDPAFDAGEWWMLVPSD